jgi:hypothetical protein
MHQNYPLRVLLLACAFFCLPAVLQAQSDVFIKLSHQQAVQEDWLGFNGQNVTSGAVSWATPEIELKIPELKPKLLRYPAAFSFWDWKVGWFTSSSLLPQRYLSWEKKPDSLENFKVVLESSNSKALFTLNLVTATLQDQVAMLQHAEALGIPVEYIELGSEFNLEPPEVGGGEGLIITDSIFPTARAYAEVANEWIDTLKYYFPEAKICVVGSYSAGGNGKKGVWNDSLRATINGREDAWAVHIYNPSAWYDSTETEEDLAQASLDEMDAWMAQPFKAAEILKTSIEHMGNGKETWITEYNLNDHFRPVQGLWGHGLYNALLTILYLDFPSVSHVISHAMAGSALYGQFFTDAVGFSLSVNDEDFPTLENPPATEPWSLSASGHALKMLSEVITGKESYCFLTFNPNPEIQVVENYGKDTISFRGLQGVLFTNAQGSEAYMMNLTGDSTSIYTQGLFSSGGSYVIKYADPTKPIATAIDLLEESGELTSTVLLPPYSILRITSGFIPSAAPQVNITATGEQNLCEGDSLQLDAGPGYRTYLWSTGETTRTIWVKQSGVYWVKANTNTKAYAGLDSFEVVLNPLPPTPEIDRSGPLEFCEGKSTTLTLDSPVPGGVTYAWNTGATSSSIDVTATGDYWLSFTDSIGCASQSEVFSVTVFPLPVASVTAGGATTFCDGGSVLLTAYPSGMTYKWSNGATTQTITADKTSSLSVTVTDANSCKGTSAITAITEVVLPNPAITVSGSLTYCSGATPTSLSTITGYAYQWKKGSSNISGATGISYTPVSTGTYKVTITDVNGCTKTTSTGKTVTINGSPTASISTTDSNICAGETTVLTANSGSGISYQWKKNGNNIGGATNSTYTCSSAATYTCKVTKTSTGCTTTSNELVITGNCKTNEETPRADYLSIYPNPAQDVFHVSFYSMETSMMVIELRNSLGQLADQWKMESAEGINHIDLPVSHLPAGVYLLNLKGKTTTASTLVVKE